MLSYVSRALKSKTNFQMVHLLSKQIFIFYNYLRILVSCELRHKGPDLYLPLSCQIKKPAVNISMYFDWENSLKKISFRAPRPLFLEPLNVMTKLLLYCHGMTLAICIWTEICDMAMWDAMLGEWHGVILHILERLSVLCEHSFRAT